MLQNKQKHHPMLWMLYVVTIFLSVQQIRCFLFSPNTLTQKYPPTSNNPPLLFPNPMINNIERKSVRTFASVPASTSEYSNENDISVSKRKSKLSVVAKWHANRRRAMIQKHPEIKDLENTRSLFITLPLLMIANTSLTLGSIVSGNLSIPLIVMMAFGVGSMFSLWQLQILHECLHGSMLGTGTKLHRKIHKLILFLGSFPSAFGYWLYLQYGHMSHHRSVGVHSLNDAFTSESMDLADGDVLFVNHRMDMKGESGPQINGVAISVGRFFYQFWKEGAHIRNALLFSTSFLLERCMLMYNDVVVAIMGKNFFFPNKPKEFHDHVSLYTRVGLSVRIVLCILAGTFVISNGGAPGDIVNTISLPLPSFLTNLIAPAISSTTPVTSSYPFLSNAISMTSFYWSWKPILFLMLSETLWSLPPHPACAMFITNHGSKYDDESEGNSNCQPSGSTYAGKLYSMFTLGTNYHVEHHDFPTMPLHQLGKLKDIAGPDFYGNGREIDDLGDIMKKAFAYPDFYACSNAGDLTDIKYADEN